MYVCVCVGGGGVGLQLKATEKENNFENNDKWNTPVLYFSDFSKQYIVEVRKIPI